MFPVRPEEEMVTSGARVRSGYKVSDTGSGNQTQVFYKNKWPLSHLTSPRCSFVLFCFSEDLFLRVYVSVYATCI